jgi:hypothetical protein
MILIHNRMHSIKTINNSLHFYAGCTITQLIAEAAGKSRIEFATSIRKNTGEEEGDSSAVVETTPQLCYNLKTSKKHLTFIEIFSIQPPEPPEENTDSWSVNH